MEPTFPQIKKILFTTDLSRQTHQAFSYAAGLASQYGASLTILFVMEETPHLHSQDFKDFLGEKRWTEIRQSHEEEIRQLLIGKKHEAAVIRQTLGEMLETVHEGVDGRDLRADRIVVTQGDVVDGIVTEVQTHGIDLIVMGYHRRGRLEEIVSGSVSRSVLRKIHVPVLLVQMQEG